MSASDRGCAMDGIPPYMPLILLRNEHYDLGPDQRYVHYVEATETVPGPFSILQDQRGLRAFTGTHQL
jgi:hypothetical protein